MSETNYQLLVIVGLVGLVAVIAMLDQRIILEDVAEFQPPSQEVTLNPPVVGVEGKYDFNGDGYITYDDSGVLANMLDQNICRSDVDCDVNNDGVLDYLDLTMFNTAIVGTYGPQTETVRTSTGSSWTIAARFA